MRQTENNGGGQRRRSDVRGQTSDVRACALRRQRGDWDSYPKLASLLLHERCALLAVSTRTRRKPVALTSEICLLTSQIAKNIFDENDEERGTP